MACKDVGFQTILLVRTVSNDAIIYILVILFTSIDGRHRTSDYPTITSHDQPWLRHIPLDVRWRWNAAKHKAALGHV
jgi:hypothetical protein